jgi:HNH endonuclease
MAAKDRDLMALLETASPDGGVGWLDVLTRTLDSDPGTAERAYAPDELDNGLALCTLHHKLFDLGALGLDLELQVQVSAAFSARTSAGRAVYDLHGLPLRPRPGTLVPAARHVEWHRDEVFKGEPLSA